MQKYIKIYCDYFGYDISSYISCEICGDPAVDIHHIECKGMGGSKLKDFIENLMALCRKCHEEYGDITEFKELLKEIHQKWITQKHTKQRN